MNYFRYISILFFSIAFCSVAETIDSHQENNDFQKALELTLSHYDSNKEPDMNYLKNFEKKYNINLWKLIINERIFYNFFNFYNYSKNEILSIVEQICRFYEKIFDEISPNFFITKLTAFHHLELIRLNLSS